MPFLFTDEEACVAHTEHSGFLRIPSLYRVTGGRGNGIVIGL